MTSIDRLTAPNKRVPKGTMYLCTLHTYKAQHGVMKGIPLPQNPHPFLVSITPHPSYMYLHTPASRKAEYISSRNARENKRVK